MNWKKKNNKATKADQNQAQIVGSQPKSKFTAFELLSTAISIVALLVSLITYYKTSAAPYEITINPPAITQTNTKVPSLILDLSAINSGASPVIIDDWKIRTSGAGKPLSVVLHVQLELGRHQKIGTLNLDKEHTQSAIFSPQQIRANDLLQTRMEFLPFASELNKLDNRDFRKIDTLHIDVRLNGRWHRNIFTLAYSGYKEKYISDEVLEVPELAFPPTYFRSTEPYKASGSFWSND